MRPARIISFLLWTALLLPACGTKKKTVLLSGEEPVSAGDFVAFFRPLNLPFYYADSSLRKKQKESDSLLISYKVFTAVVPDTVLSRIYGKSVKPKIYAIGRTQGPNKEMYLLVKTIAGEKKAMLLLGFSRENMFSAVLTALRPDQDAATNQSFVIDKRHTVSKTVMRKNRDGSLSEGKDVYAFNAESQLFYLVMTDALEDKPTELINPIDTLPRSFKWSADYSNGKMNLVSVRDGRRSGKIRFFIHFDKGGNCSGEIKGEADIVSPNSAEYRQDGDPCKLKFIFTSSSVTLKEIEGCGSYRPLNCSLDASYTRKKDNRVKQTNVKHKSSIK